VEIEKEKRENEKQKIFKGSPVKYCLNCGRKKWSCRCYRVSGFEELKNAKRRMLSQSKKKV
jgi:hypothetical protein